MALPLFDTEVKALSSLFGKVKTALTSLIGRVFGGSVEATEAEQATGELIDDLLDACDEWVQDHVPTIYARGAEDAAKSMGENPTALSDKHEDIVDSLMDDVLEDLEGSVREAERQARARIREATRHKAVSDLSGQATTRDAPLFTDRAGREWDFERYAEMKLRDWVTDTLNTGAATAAMDLGSPGIRISDGHYVDTDEPCRQANGQVWSAAYFHAHTKEHPQCQRRGKSLPKSWTGELDRG